MDKLPPELRLEIIKYVLIPPRVIHVLGYFTDLYGRRLSRNLSWYERENLYFEPTFDQYNAIKQINRKWRATMNDSGVPRVGRQIKDSASTIVHIQNINDILDEFKETMYIQNLNIKNIALHIREANLICMEKLTKFILTIRGIKRIYLVVDSAVRDKRGNITKDVEQDNEGIKDVKEGKVEGPLKENGRMTYPEFRNAVHYIRRYKKILDWEPAKEVKVVRWKLSKF